MLAKLLYDIWLGFIRKHLCFVTRTQSNAATNVTCLRLFNVVTFFPLNCLIFKSSGNSEKNVIITETTNPQQK